MEKSTGWGKRSFLVLFLTIILIPLFFYPLRELSSDVPKKYLLVASVLTAFLFWLVQILKDRGLSVPRTNIYWGGLAILVVSFLSALFSGSIKYSLIGYYFETGSFSSLLVLCLLAFLCSNLFVSQKRVVNLYLGVLLSFFIVIIFQALVIFANISWLNGATAIFNNRSVSLLGGWNDLAIFAGFIALSATIFLEYIPLSYAKVFKNILIGALVLALLFLVLINFYTVWVVLATFALFLLIYNVSFGIFSHSGEKKNIFYSFSFILAVFSVVFAIFAYPSGFLNTKLNNLNHTLNLNFIEVRPSFDRTVVIAQQVLQTEPWLGTGTNNFDQAWQKFKPKTVNATPFWNASFDHGNSFVTTVIVNNGYLGLIAWLSFFGFLLYAGFKALFFKKNDFSRAMILLVFSSVLYLWAIAFLYVPGVTILTLLFALTGILVAVLSEAKMIGSIDLSWVLNSRLKFIVKNVFGVIVLGLVLVFYLTVTSAWSLVGLQRSLTAYAKGDVAVTENLLRKAVLINPQDVFYRNIIDLDITKLDGLLKNSELTKTDLVKEVQVVSVDMTNIAGLVATTNPNNYLNFMWSGKAYEALMNLGALGFYEKSQNSYTQAASLSPNNPLVYLSLARLEIFNKDDLKARQYLEKALALKPDYTEAILLEAQLNLQDGSFSEAVKRLEDALVVAPNDISIMFQLGYLEYRRGNFVSSAEVLNRLLGVSPSYSDAKYFLGLDYDKLGDRTAALGQFIELRAVNPNNKEIGQIINNLNSGREALAVPVSEKASSTKKK